MSYAHLSYKSANVTTADRGKLVIMIYDHCIKWCRKAEEEMLANNTEKTVKAVKRVQSGITELMCSLDMEKGGDISKNLFRLYDFYSRHLSNSMKNKSPQGLQEVITMMSSLRDAWLVAIENVRRDDPASLSEKTSSSLSLVS